MSMQPYQPNSIELQKQQVRKYSRNTAIALLVTVGALPLWMFLDTGFLVLVILAGIVAIYNGNKVRKTISGDSSSAGELY